MAELTCIHEAASPEAVHVVFIHGLGGHFRGTWMSNAKDHTTLWPQWLGEDTCSTVWLLSYDAALSGWTGDAMHLADQGVALMTALTHEKALQGKRLVLVGHSLGGLVIKAGMTHVATQHSPRLSPALNSISAVVFVGTPHQGANLATVATAVSGLLRTNSQVRNIQQNDGWLKSLNGQFQKLQSELVFHVHVFFETHGVFIGKKVLGLRFGKPVVIVDRNSSDPQIPGSTATPLELDHIQIAKPESRKAVLYKAMVAVIEEASNNNESLCPPSNNQLQSTDIEDRKNPGPVVPAYREAAPAESVVTAEQLRQIARKLLDSGLPSSISSVFPDATATVSQALAMLSEIDRFVIEVGDEKNSSLARHTFQTLTNLDKSKHLVIAAPGSGKTHALWKAANWLLSSSALIPLFLPIGGLTTWSQVRDIISDVSPELSPEKILRDPRVCVCIDGWSEFATGEHISEKSKALRVLQEARVIANARHSDASDSAFKMWKLESIPLNAVSIAVQRARPGSPEIPESLLDLLRLPLMLSLFLLSGKNEGSAGALLQDFHERLTRNMPEKFSDALSRAVATITASGERSYGRLISQLRRHADELNVPEPIRLFESLGSITNRAGQAAPVHDLYWSWLCGRGLLQGAGTKDAITRLSTRESYTLALQSGDPVRPALVEDTVEFDWLLAAKLTTEVGSHQVLSETLALGLADPRLAIRARAALASLMSQNSKYLPHALQTLSELYVHRATGRDWIDAFEPAVIFPLRGVIAEWVGSPGTNYLLESIAGKGTSEWVDWLEQMATAGKISWDDAVATALACAPGIPTWGNDRLYDLVRNAPWGLRQAAVRRSNLTLAMTLASDYSRVIEHSGSGRSSGWIAVNRVILGCGNDETFERLLADFDDMTAKAQELLGFAVVDRGGQWVARFQKVAFALPKQMSHDSHHHKLEEVMSLDIDDDTARQWIAAGYGKPGWRVLIARHGLAMLPELIAALPPSFSGIDYVPELEYLAFLDNAPESLIPEIWGRVRGQMQPKTTQDVLLVAATIKPRGMLSIVEFLKSTAFSIPAYHLDIVLQIYRDWQRDTGHLLKIDISAKSRPLDEYIALCALENDWEHHATPSLISRCQNIAIEAVITRFANDEARQERILDYLKVSVFHNGLFETMLKKPSLAKLIPRVFSDCFESFPESAVIAAIHCSDIEQNALFYRLSHSSNPLHRRAHGELITRELQKTEATHDYHLFANLLRSHPRYDLINLLTESILKGGLETMSERALWLIREVEDVRGELLITEAGVFIP
ncbi:alpha/beta fold hydrolase [Pseudomonas viridiflava]|uniref:esterase/lipase family protein n=1 Tax=Pseudomonas viridiflava TaxID=33069 RepID=UPI00211D94A1|nr:alpha/beta fold hydrolase [Pseudomonas viridiflava]MCQ9391395.1 alpha/beta fold hydrolase [Pseudomonas viridiflava]